MVYAAYPSIVDAKFRNTHGFPQPPATVGALEGQALLARHRILPQPASHASRFRTVESRRAPRPSGCYASSGPRRWPSAADLATLPPMPPAPPPIPINRVPVLTLWATVVAERVGHAPDTALTLARPKARRLGIMDEAQQASERNAAAAGLKPRVQTVRLLGRGILLLDGSLCR